MSKLIRPWIDQSRIRLSKIAIDKIEKGQELSGSQKHWSFTKYQISSITTINRLPKKLPISIFDQQTIKLIRIAEQTDTNKIFRFESDLLFFRSFCFLTMQACKWTFISHWCDFRLAIVNYERRESKFYQQNNWQDFFYNNKLSLIYFWEFSNTIWQSIDH